MSYRDNRPPPPSIPRRTPSCYADDTAREKGDIDTAITHYTAAVTADPSSVEAELRLGSADLARKDDAGATAAYQAAQKLAPTDPEAAFRLGEFALTHGQAKDGSDQFAVALATRKDDPKLYNAMGVSLAMQHEYAAYDKGLALEPDHPSLRDNTG